ncbi:MAG: glycoside hydrolase, partial [Actinobacteria bacterium]|nr:glycoside hydrolase [Actinomycetota bacterium]
MMAVRSIKVVLVVSVLMTLIMALLLPSEGVERPDGMALSIFSDHSQDHSADASLMSAVTDHHIVKTDQSAGGKAVAHYEDGERRPGIGLEKKAPHAELYPTGTQAAEPTMGIQKDGTMFFVGTDGPHADTPFGPAPTKLEWPVMRSDDGGKTWTDVSPVVGDQRRHAMAGLDPMLHVDPDTGRVFTVDLQIVECHTVSFSDDDGDSWTTSEACGVADHQTVFTGPPVTSPTIGYPNIVYDCAID